MIRWCGQWGIIALLCHRENRMYVEAAHVLHHRICDSATYPNIPTDINLCNILIELMPIAQQNNLNMSPSPRLNLLFTC